ncbi:hypothetical protein AAE478_006479 [Parahypoxylon ruwenzoriense]
MSVMTSWALSTKPTSPNRGKRVKTSVEPDVAGDKKLQRIIKGGEYRASSLFPDDAELNSGEKVSVNAADL